MTATGTAREAAGLGVPAVVEAAGIAALAGALAGLLVGIGARVAMRVVGSMTDASLVGIAQTNNGFTVGNVTAIGTFGLILFGGFAPGFVGGAAYAAARPWLAPLGRWGGLAFGLVLLGALGPLVLEPFNIDFRKFGVPLVNVAMFTLLFPLFGVALGIALPRVERSVRGARGASLWPVLAIVAVPALVLIFVLGLVSVFGTSLDGGDIGQAGAAFLYLLAAPVVLRIVLSLGLRPMEQARTFDDVRALGRPVQVVTYAVLLAPALLIAPATLDAIRFLAR